jgi:hypothetical protein
MEKLLGAPGSDGRPSILSQMPPEKARFLTGKTFFPHLISDPFLKGLRIAFTASLVMCLVAAAASWMRGAKFVYEEEVGAFGAPLRADADPGDSPEPEEWISA